MSRAEGLIAAALAAFPVDPDWPDDRLAITGHYLVEPEGDDPAVRYWVPEIGDAWPVARAVVHAVLADIAEHGFGDGPTRLAEQVAGWTP